MALPNTITVQVDADTLSAVTQVVSAAKVMEKALGSISADIDFDEAGTNKKADSAGTNANKSWWKGFQKEDEKGSKKATSRLGRLLTKWTGIIAAFGETIGVALYGAGGSILSLGASLLSAASASAAFIPIAVGLGAAIGAIAIGAQGVGGAIGAMNDGFKEFLETGETSAATLKKIEDSLKLLAPNAQEFVVEFGKLLPVFRDLQQSVQQKLFEDLGVVLRDLAANQLPSLSVAFTEVAGAINESFKGFIDGLEGYDLGGILSGLVPIISNVLNALTPLTTAFLDFLIVATPYAETLSEQFLNWAQSIADFTSSAGGVEAIEGFLDRAVASLQSWLDLIGATGKVISTFMRIASSEGDGLVDSLTRSLNTFNDWMKSAEGETAVTQFLETSSRILKALGPLLKGVQGFFTNLVTPDSVTRFEDLASALGEILPILGDLLHALGEARLLNIFAEAILAIGNALTDSGAMDAIASLATVIGDTLGGVIQSIVDSGVLISIGRALAAIGAVAEAILPALGQLIEEVFSDPDLIQAFNEGLVAVTDAMNALLPAVLILIPPLNDMVLALLPPLLQLLPPLAELIGALAPVVTLWANALAIAIGVQTTYFGFLANVAVGVLETLIGWLTSLVDLITGAVTAAFEGLSSAWQATTEDVAAFYERNIAPVVEKVAAFGRSVIGVFRTVRDSVTEAWRQLTQGVVDLWNRNVAPWLAAIPGAFQAVWDGVKRGFQAFIDFFKRLWADAKSAWDDTLVDLRQFGNDAVAFFAGLPARFASALSGIVSAIGDQFRKAWETAKGYVDRIKNLPGSIAGGVGNFIGGLNPFAKGGIVFGPTPALIGEAGAEAVIPLQKPLSQIDPSVRAMAALLRNGPTTNAGNANNTAARITRAQTNNFTINDMTGNAEATAQKIVNRLVSL